MSLLERSSTAGHHHWRRQPQKGLIPLPPSFSSVTRPPSSHSHLSLLKRSSTTRLLAEPAPRGAHSSSSLFFLLLSFVSSYFTFASNGVLRVGGLEPPCPTLAPP